MSQKARSSVMIRGAFNSAPDTTAVRAGIRTMTSVCCVVLPQPVGEGEKKKLERKGRGNVSRSHHRRRLDFQITAICFRKCNLGPTRLTVNGSRRVRRPVRGWPRGRRDSRTPSLSPGRTTPDSIELKYNSTFVFIC